MIVRSHIGTEYTVTGKVTPRDNVLYTVRIPVDKRRISEKYDMEIAVGGMRMYINSDGTMVKGYNTFTKGTLAKIYAFLKAQSL